MSDTLKLFSLEGKVVVITGGAGLLGIQHAEAIADLGGIPVLIDINKKEGIEHSKRISEKYGNECEFFQCDVTDENSVKKTILSVILNNPDPLENSE